MPRFVCKADWRTIVARDLMDLYRPKVLALSAGDKIEFTNSQVLHHNLRVACVVMRRCCYELVSTTNWCGPVTRKSWEPVP